MPMLWEAVCGRCIYARVFIHGSSGTSRAREVHSCKGIYYIFTRVGISVSADIEYRPILNIGLYLPISAKPIYRYWLS